jgi:hypothetical protein
MVEKGAVLTRPAKSFLPDCWHDGLPRRAEPPEAASRHALRAASAHGCERSFDKLRMTFFRCGAARQRAAGSVLESRSFRSPSSPSGGSGQAVFAEGDGLRGEGGTAWSQSDGEGRRRRSPTARGEPVYPSSVRRNNSRKRPTSTRSCFMGRRPCMAARGVAIRGSWCAVFSIQFSVFSARIGPRVKMPTPENCTLKTEY